MNLPSTTGVSCALAAVADWSALFGQAISPAGLQRVGWVLLHFLWQGSAVAALLVIALWLLRGQSAAIRYRVACGALLAMAVAPVATCWLIAPGTPMTAGPVRASLITASGQPTADFARPVNGKETSVAEERFAPTGGAAPVISADGTSSPASIWTWCVVAWAVGASALSTWRAAGWLHLRRLIRRIEPVGGTWADRVQMLALQMGVGRQVRLAEAAWVAVPCAIEFFRPLVLVPAAALAGLTPAQLEAILAHELAHIRRNDYLVNLVQAALETVLFYHPAVWWVSARVREEREYCCDDVAAATRPSPADYADALLAAEVMRDTRARSLPAHLAQAALGGGRTNGPLPRRVRRVLGLPPVRTGDRVFVRPLTASAVAAACVVMPWVMARAEKPAATAPAAHVSPTTIPATGPSAAPATAPADELAGAEPPGPDDLVPDKRPYLISPSDLLTIEISDLTGPGTQTVKTTRVKEDGTIAMPYLSAPIHAEGLTEGQLEQAIVDRYRIENIIQRAQIVAVLTEVRVRAFKVLGDVPQPGPYAIVDADLRLLDALTLTGADVTKLDKVYVVRRLRIGQTAHHLNLHPTAGAEFKIFHLKNGNSDATTRLLFQVFKLPEDAREKPEPGAFPYGVNAVSDAQNNNVVVTAPAQAMKVVEQIIYEADQPQTIVVSAKGLAAGDPKLNVVIHKGDTIIARGSSRSHP